MIILMLLERYRQGIDCPDGIWGNQIGTKCEGSGFD